MKITVNQKVLKESTENCLKGISSKIIQPSLECFFIKADNNEIKITGNSLDIGIEDIMAGTIEEEGSICVDAKLLNSIIRKLPEDEVSLYTEGEQVIVKCVNSEFTIVTQNPAQYTQLPEVNRDIEYVIPSVSLKNSFKKVVIATAKDEVRPILTGVLVQLKDNCLTSVALDGYRIAIQKITTDFTVENETKVVIPGESIKELVKLLPDSNEGVNIVFNDSYAMFLFKNTKVVIRLLNGEYLDYTRMIPDTFQTKFTANISELKDSIERAALLTNNSSSIIPVVMDMNDNEMGISVRCNMGTVNESIDINLEGENLRIAFNPKYILEGLSLFDSDIKLNFNSSIQPCMFTNENQDTIYIALPVRLLN